MKFKKGLFITLILTMVLVIPFAAYAVIDLGASGAAAKGPQVKYVPASLPYEVNPKKTALFIIDAQKVYSNPFTLDPSELALGYTPLHCDNFDDSIVKINQIAAACREKGIPVFVIKHVYRADGSNCGRLCDFDPLGFLGFPKAWNLWREDLVFSQLDERLVVESNDYLTEKSIYSSFTKPVADKLKDLDVDTVIITGFMTQYCSTTATRHGHDLGYKMIYVSDANDGPMVEVLLGGPDENTTMSLWLGIPVADVTDTAGLLNRLQ